MDVKKIIYYTCEDGKKIPLSLRNICLREEYDRGLETIFYAVRDVVDAQALLTSLQRICHESIELFEEQDSVIVFTVVDAYDRTNYLKIRKQRTINQ